MLQQTLPKISHAPRDPHSRLYDDIALLGQFLEEVIRDQVGEQALDRIETIRSLAESAHRDGGENAERLVRILTGLAPDDLLMLTRAFSQFLNLANIAEQYHRIRRRRSYQTLLEPRPQGGSLEELLPRLTKAGHEPSAILNALSELRIEFVLTAHPTEVCRRTIINKHDGIAKSLELLDRSDLSPVERNEIHRQLRRLILAAWHTPDVRDTQPTPLDEARWGANVIERYLWQAVPRFLRELEGTVQRSTGEALPVGCSPVHFASWMGGDRDGNPYVTAAVTERVILMNRWTAANLFLRDIEHLYADLSMSKCSSEFRAYVGDSNEPYRTVLAQVRSRLSATRDWALGRLQGLSVEDSNVYTNSDEILAPLMMCYRSLVESKLGSIARGELSDTIRRLACFGISLLRLDIRQESSRHTDALSAVTEQMGLGIYREWDEAQRQSFLLRYLSVPEDELPTVSSSIPEIGEVFETMAVIARQPSASLGAYVISMASSPSDVLAVYLLQRLAGVRTPMRVVPLFETLTDLKGAASTIELLLREESYRQQIGNHQEVMIGYSDSAKDGGYLAAAWALYNTQEQIGAVCRQYGVKLTLFHGRGGSVSRGGAPAHKALLSQPPGTVGNSLRITAQGEVIRAQFGMVGIAVRTIELYTSAVLEASLLPPPEPQPEWRNAMDELAADSLASYRSTVRDNATFIDYFSAATPINELQKLPLGSRPAKRRQVTSIDSLRAIPWVFAWAQVRFPLTAWLGIAASLESALHNGHRQRLLEMAHAWPFFRSILDMLEMVLAKTEPLILSHYETTLVPEELHNVGNSLRDELARVSSCVRQLTGHSELLQEDSVIARSLRVRTPYTFPLSLLQVELLRRSRNESTPDAQLVQALMGSITGIAAGMRNTG